VFLNYLVTKLPNCYSTMLSYNELKPGAVFVWKGDPWLVLEYDFLRKQQRKPVARTKIRNLKNGKLLEQTFHYSDQFEEADIERYPVKYLYNNRGEYWFSAKEDPSDRFSLSEEIIGGTVKFLKQNTEVTASKFDDEIISVELPIKVELEVAEAPPSIKGSTAQGGNKSVTLETGATINVPMFINSGDIVRVNTQTGEYVERTEKSSGL
jgi:elongation factor P